MKTMLSMLVVLPLFTMAQEKSIFICLSPSYTFQVKQSTQTKQLIGTLHSPSKKPTVMTCMEKDTGYVCKKGDYIAKVFRGATTGRKIVQLELEGEFDVESGYLDTIYCR